MATIYKIILVIPEDIIRYILSYDRWFSVKKINQERMTIYRLSINIPLVQCHPDSGRWVSFVKLDKNKILTVNAERYFCVMYYYSMEEIQQKYIRY